MRLETEVEHYLCEQCDPRPVDRVRVPCVFVGFITQIFPLISPNVVFVKGGSDDTAAELCSSWFCLLHLPPER